MVFLNHSSYRLCFQFLELCSREVSINWQPDTDIYNGLQNILELMLCWTALFQYSLKKKWWHRAQLRKWSVFPKGLEMPWSRVISPAVYVSLWDFPWAYSFAPASGLCWPNFSPWLLIRCVTGPDCHQKWIGAFLPLVMANLLGFTLPTVTVCHNTTVPPVTQKGSSKTKCGVSQSGCWGVTTNLLCWTLPLPTPPTPSGQDE